MSSLQGQGIALWLSLITSEGTNLPCAAQKPTLGKGLSGLTGQSWSSYSPNNAETSVDSE